MTNTQKNIIGLYSMMMAGGILSVIPYSLFPMAGMACILVVWISAIVQKLRAKDDEIIRFHMSYINRTVLWSILVMMLCIFLFGCLVFFNGDMSAIKSMMRSAESGIILETGDVAMMQYEFVMANKDLIVWAALISFIPYPAYLIYKSVKGVRILLEK